MAFRADEAARIGYEQVEAYLVQDHETLMRRNGHGVKKLSWTSLMNLVLWLIATPRGTR